MQGKTLNLAMKTVSLVITGALSHPLEEKRPPSILGHRYAKSQRGRKRETAQFPPPKRVEFINICKKLKLPLEAGVGVEMGRGSGCWRLMQIPQK